jgi:hypothetical protein
MLIHLINTLAEKAGLPGLHERVTLNARWDDLTAVQTRVIDTTVSVDNERKAHNLTFGEPNQCNHSRLECKTRARD